MKRPRPAILWAVTAAYAALLAGASLLPSGPDVLGGWDTAITPTLQNALHVPAYAGLAVLASLAAGRPSLARLALIALACFALGILLECAQSHVPGRTASVSDALHNLAGAVIGASAIGLVLRARPGPGPEAHGTPTARQRRRQRSRDMIRRHYHAGGWQSPFAKYEALLAEMIEPSCTVLDVGCGHDFWMAPFLKGLASEVYGVDPVAQAAAAATGAGVVRASVNHLPFRDGSFDVVTSRFVFEHLKDPLPAFSELRRVLKPGGRIVFVAANKYDYVSLISAAVPNRLHPRLLKALEGRDDRDTFPTYYRANSARGVTKMAARCGLSAERLEYANHYPYLLRFSPLLCRIGIAYDGLIQKWRALHCLQATLLGSLRKPPRPPDGAKP